MTSVNAVTSAVMSIGRSMVTGTISVRRGKILVAVLYTKSRVVAMNITKNEKFCTRKFYNTWIFFRVSAQLVAVI